MAKTVIVSNGQLQITMGSTKSDATAGSVIFAGTSGVMQQDNANLFWDDSNNRLGIGIATPQKKLQLYTAGSVEVYAQFTNDTTGSSSGDGFAIGIRTGSIAIINQRADSDLEFNTNGTRRWMIGSTGILQNWAGGNESTGAGTALLGANSPASTLSAPYTWIKLKTSDDSVVYMPVWK